MRITLGDILSGRVRIVVRRRRSRLPETAEVADLRAKAKAILPGRLREQTQREQLGELLQQRQYQLKPQSDASSGRFEGLCNAA